MCGGGVASTKEKMARYCKTITHSRILGKAYDGYAQEDSLSPAGAAPGPPHIFNLFITFLSRGLTHPGPVLAPVV